MRARILALTRDILGRGVRRHNKRLFGLLDIPQLVHALDFRRTNLDSHHILPLLPGAVFRKPDSAGFVLVRMPDMLEQLIA